MAVHEVISAPPQRTDLVVYQALFPTIDVGCLDIGQLPKTGLVRTAAVVLLRHGWLSLVDVDLTTPA